MNYTCYVCGHTIKTESGKTTEKCAVCGKTVALPQTQDEYELSILRKATCLRLQYEYDRALSLFGELLATRNDSIQAYWGKVLCKFGVEYVRSADNKRYIPMCHWKNNKSVLNDEDFLFASKNAPTNIASILTLEALDIDVTAKKQINLTKGLAPFDIYICCKCRTDPFIKKTKLEDRAQEIYDVLASNGFNVYFSDIYLSNDKSEVNEVIRFNALNTARVMLVIGKESDDFDSITIKDEINRFKKRMKREDGLLIIPCHESIEAYELPDELTSYTSLKLTRITFLQELLSILDNTLQNGCNKHTKAVNNIQSRKTELEETLLISAQNRLSNAKSIEDYAGIIDTLTPILENEKAQEIIRMCQEEIDYEKTTTEWNRQVRETVDQYYPAMVITEEVKNSRFKNAMISGKTVKEAYEIAHESEFKDNHIITVNEINSLIQLSNKVLQTPYITPQFIGSLNQILDKIGFSTRNDKRRNELYNSIAEIARELAVQLHNKHGETERAQQIESSILNRIKNTSVYTKYLEDLSVFNSLIKEKERQINIKQKKAKMKRIVNTLLVLIVIISIVYSRSRTGTNTNTNTGSAKTVNTTPTPLPAAVYNGEILISTDFEQVCPFTVKGDSNRNYYIYLEYQGVPTRSTVSRAKKKSAKAPYHENLAFYLASGQSVTIDVPVGKYKLYYATGDTFFDTKILFGTNTAFFTSGQLLDFYTDANYSNGHTITLKAVYNGNFDTDRIDESSFPRD